MSSERLLTVQDVVDRLQVHEQTVRRWLRSGELRGYSLGRKSGWRIRERDLETFLEERAGGPEGKVAA